MLDVALDLTFGESRHGTGKSKPSFCPF
jgi:hypothetical protein